MNAYELYMECFKIYSELLPDADENPDFVWLMDADTYFKLCGYWMEERNKWDSITLFNIPIEVVDGRNICMLGLKVKING